jgi:uncharacterized protein Yka (UPF0111/DUF47 family)
MHMRTSKVTHGLATGVLVGVMVILFSTQGVSQAQENPEVTRLLADARDKAAQLSKDADEMESLTRTDADWETHADALNRMKEDVNSLARDTEKLAAARNSASPWQKQAIDRMLPLMKDLASNTTAAINHLSQNKTRPTTPEYTEYLKENDDTAHQLADTISNFVQYGHARAKMEKLEQKLEIASR